MGITKLGWYYTVFNQGGQLNSHTPPQNQRSICPKCGYDQSGIIDTWNDQCPMTGRCSECGLSFAWRDVFDPLLNDLYWYAEHARSNRAMIRRTPGTLVRLLNPIQFWNEVDVAKPIKLRTLAVWVLLTIITTHVLVSIPLGIGLWGRSTSSWGSLTILEYIDQYSLYGIAELTLDALFDPAMRTWISTRGGSGYSLRFQAGQRHLIYAILIKPIVFQVGFVMLWTTVLVAIPYTRRVTKVRAKHVIRAILLSVLMLGLSFEFTRLIYGIMMWMGFYWNGFAVARIYRIVVPVLVLWQLIYWSSVISIGWRVQPWRLLVVLGTIAALLGGFALRVYVFLASTL